MIKIKPVLYTINAFDASNDYIFKFSWSGNQSFASIAEIRENENNNIVYLETQETMQLQHTLLGDVLTNGTLYNIRIATVDSDGNVSDYSNPVLFYCYSTPIFKFDNLESNQIVQNSSYQVTMTYSQTENEPLQSYEITLYDTSKNVIQSSNVKYSVDEIKYTLSGLEDNQAYYIKATGQTLNGMDIETDYIYFTVNYVQPAIYSILNLENNANGGYIKLQSNIKSISCHTKNNPIFIDDEYLDLSNDILTMDKDFILKDDFVINLSGYNLSYGLIMQLSNDTNNNAIYVYLRKGTYDINDNIEKTFIELVVPVSEIKYICYSNYIDNPSSTQMLSIWITKDKGLFQVEIKEDN